MGFFILDENFFLNKKDRTKYIYSNDKSRLLLFNIIDTLNNVFLHDTDKFVLANDRFSSLMQPLVDQVQFNKILLFFTNYFIFFYRLKMKLKIINYSLTII